jgi:hypothetical protein
MMYHDGFHIHKSIPDIDAFMVILQDGIHEKLKYDLQFVVISFDDWTQIVQGPTRKWELTLSWTA